MGGRGPTLQFPDPIPYFTSGIQRPKWSSQSRKKMANQENPELYQLQATPVQVVEERYVVHVVLFFVHYSDDSIDTFEPCFSIHLIQLCSSAM